MGREGGEKDPRGEKKKPLGSLTKISKPNLNTLERRNRGVTSGAPLGETQNAPPPRKLNSKVHMGGQKNRLDTSPWTERLGQRKNTSLKCSLFSSSGISRTSTQNSWGAREVIQENGTCPLEKIFRSSSPKQQEGGSLAEPLSDKEIKKIDSPHASTPTQAN